MWGIACRLLETPRICAAKTTIKKSIDFDPVADLYDVLVRVDYDIEFWKEEALAAGGKTLELMCGTGRIGKPLIENGAEYVGLDYCQKLLDQFQKKLDALGLGAKLVFGDARHCQLTEHFALVFVGFSSLSEVLHMEDKNSYRPNTTRRCLSHGS